MYFVRKTPKRADARKKTRIIKVFAYATEAERAVIRMKIMIDISDSTYEAIMARDWKNAGWLFGEELKAIHDGTPFPKTLRILT